MLDVGRHFFPVPFILKLLDVCAFYKINKFHWHLTEDQVTLLAADDMGWLPNGLTVDAILCAGLVWWSRQAQSDDRRLQAD